MPSLEANNTLVRIEEREICVLDGRFSVVVATEFFDDINGPQQQGVLILRNARMQISLLLIEGSSDEEIIKRARTALEEYAGGPSR